MPSAEPAPTPEPAVNAGSDAGARIIPLTPRVWRDASSGGAADMPHPPQHQPGADGGSEADILRPVAEALERRLEVRRQTLADPRTLDAVHATLEIAQAVLDGAHARGTVDADQSALLAALVDGIRRAADHAHHEAP